MTFTCRGTGDILNWTVDTLPVDKTIYKEWITINDTSEGHNLSSTLTFEVPPTNDDITIGCVIVILPPQANFRAITAKLMTRGDIVDYDSMHVMQITFQLYRSVISRECQLES